MNAKKNMKKSMKKMKNTDEFMQREYVGKNFQVKSESEKWHLFIDKTSEDKMGIFFQIFTHWVT